MSAHLERARLLLQHSRSADAEREAGLALAQQPDDPHAHALLALCRVNLKKNDAALEAARAAVGLAPDSAYFHYVHAVVLHRLDRETEARTAINEAIRLDPDDEDNFTLLASIELAQRNWPAALEAAERALALNPEHVEGANLRAMALVRLGRKAEAMETVDYALERAPESAFSHANQGWNCLHRNEPRRAQEHFREALRLEPDLEYARQGMLEALKARNPVYRGMLAYFLWMGRLSGKLQWAFILVTFFVVGFVREMADQKPELGWLLWPLVVGFYVFIYLSWTSGPLFNLLLRFDRFGRLVLSRAERIASNWFALPFALAVVGLVTWAVADGSLATLGGLVAAMSAMLSVCVAATFMRQHRARWILMACTAALTLTAMAAFGLLITGNQTGLALLRGFFLGFLGFQIAANVVR